MEKQSLIDESGILAATLDDETSRKTTLATSDFLIRVSQLYGDKTPPFLAADCASKALSLTSRLQKANMKIPAQQKLSKLRRSLCTKCKTCLIVGKTAELRWQSSASSSYLRRFRGKKRVDRICKRKEAGLELSKYDTAIYSRYLKRHRRSIEPPPPSLVIACRICGSDVRLSIGNSDWSVKKNERHSLIHHDDHQQSTPIDASVQKRRKRKRLPNAGLNISGIATAAAAEIGSSFTEKGHDFTKDSSFVGVADSKPSKTKASSCVVTPNNTASASQKKRKFQTRLEKLLAAEESSKEKRVSFGNASGLASFLESL